MTVLTRVNLLKMLQHNGLKTFTIPKTIAVDCCEVQPKRPFVSILRCKEAKIKMQQNELPRLPVPILAETTEKFLNFASAIQTDEEYKETVKIVHELNVKPEARILQRLLEDHSRQHLNWLTPWWLSVAYLEARTPLPIWTSAGATFPHFDFVGIEGQIDCATKIIQSALKYHHKIINEDVDEEFVTEQVSEIKDVSFKKMNVTQVPEKVPVKVKARLDMSQYKLLFGTTRVPRPGTDEIIYGKDRSEWARHVIVTRNGHSFVCPVYDESGQILGLEELHTQLQEIVHQSEQTNTEAVNIVSTDDRETWARLYERLKRKNQEEVLNFEKALFVMCLDETFDCDQGVSKEDQNSAMALHGGGPTQNARNRWFDKTLQFYINQNGYGGFTYEHTPANGTPSVMLLDFILDQFDANNFTKKSKTGFEKPGKMEFKLTEEDKEVIRSSEEKFKRVVQNLEVRMFEFEHFGKNVPKLARISPDAFIQLGLQVAFYRMHGTLPPTYETGTLRKFIDGRTETIRQPSSDSAKFTKAFVTDAQKHTDVELIELFRYAAHAHKEYTSQAMNGKGIDRHLFGLKLIAREKSLQLPRLFESPAYHKMMHFQLSTSQVPTRHALHIGFGPSAIRLPTSSDCYGLCYNPQNKRIYFTITAFNDCEITSALKFSKALEEAFLDMRDLLNRTGSMNKIVSKI